MCSAWTCPVQVAYHMDEAQQDNVCYCSWKSDRLSWQEFSFLLAVQGTRWVRSTMNGGFKNWVGWLFFVPHTQSLHMQLNPTFLNPRVPFRHINTHVHTDPQLVTQCNNACCHHTLQRDTINPWLAGVGLDWAAWCSIAIFFFRIALLTLKYFLCFLFLCRIITIDDEEKKVIYI